MDAGTSINIIYLSTLERINLTQRKLNPSNVKFHGIVPGRAASSLGGIKLEVTFGEPDNYLTEDISFVPFDSAHHAIFGRPAFTKFMARPCYVYNKLKMPGPNGIITVCGDFKMAKQCEQQNALCAEQVIQREELKELEKEVKPEEMPASKEATLKPAENFSTSSNTKKMKLDPKDPSKEVIIGDGMDDK